MALRAESPEPKTVELTEILFATDFSEVSAKALPYAAAIARGFGARLCVLHVISRREYENFPVAEREATIERLHLQAEQRITRLLTASHFAGIRHDVRVDHGEILPVLASEVEKRGAGLIVVGMHGRHGLEKTLLGSMAEEIQWLAEVPVLTVGPEVTVDPEAEVRVKEVLYVAGFAPGSGQALHYAEALVRRCGARMTVLYVVRDIWAEPLSTQMPGDAFLRLRMLEEDRMRSIVDLQPDLVVEFGSAEQRILEVADRRGAQLLVVDVPVNGHPALAAHLPGPLAYNLCAHARCPVIGIRSPGGRRLKCEQQ
jgi:nucleotide-binding universal stress UspA family protein